MTIVLEDDVPRSFAGVEVRVAGSGHVVGPGCRHVSGDLYESNGRDVERSTTAWSPWTRSPNFNKSLIGTRGIREMLPDADLGA